MYLYKNIYVHTVRFQFLYLLLLTGGVQTMPRLEKIKVKFLYMSSKNNTLTIVKYKHTYTSNELSKRKDDF